MFVMKHVMSSNGKYQVTGKLHLYLLITFCISRTDNIISPIHLSVCLSDFAQGYIVSTFVADTVRVLTSKHTNEQTD